VDALGQYNESGQIAWPDEVARCLESQARAAEVSNLPAIPDQHAVIPTRRHEARVAGQRCRWLFCAGWLALGLACASARPAFAQQDSSGGVINREYPLKALFLYNFGSYVEWPPDTFSSDQAPFVIGVLGSAPLERTLTGLAATKTIAGRQILVESFASVEEIKPCQILFITRDVDPRQQRLALEKLRNRRVLVVGESAGFAGQGGSVNFFIEANKIRFEINPETVKRQELKISSKLLSLAKIVQSN
jgi:hypothetical protein